MSEQQLSDALNNCIDRLAEGQTINDCVQAYPHLESELRALLEIGQASSTNRASASEVTHMRLRLDLEIENLIATSDFDSPSPFRLPQGVTVLVASLILVVIGISLFLNNGIDNTTGRQMTQTAEATSDLTITASPSAIEIATKSPTCPLPSNWTMYQVQSDDTLSLIAIRSGITVEVLREANCLSGSENVIVAGQVLYVPRSLDNDNDSDDGDNDDDSDDDDFEDRDDDD